MSKFQMILTGIFIILAVGGVIIFSAYKGSSGDAVTVVIWGTIPEATFSEVVQATSLYQSKEFKIEYKQKNVTEFDTDFVEALASGRGPDIFMLPSDKMLKHRNKIFPIPYNVFTQRQFKDYFIEGTEIYMAPEGTLAFPIWTDPLVMYWNRTIFTEAKLTQPPKYWDEFHNLAKLITKKDGALNIQRSAVAFGEFSNISNAKAIILNLVMQAGNPVAVWNGLNVSSVFADSSGGVVTPAEAAVNFYTEFGNPAKSSYSWNRSLSASRDYFLSGDLGIYFGFASEISNLQLKNPNLNFDVSEVPTERESKYYVSFANFQGLAITKATKVPAAAFSVISILSGKDGVKAFSEALNLPPTRRDLLDFKPTDAYMSVFYDSAIRAKTWLDPEPTESNTIFKNMIESITSGRSRTGEAVLKAHRELTNLLSKYAISQ